MEGDFTTDGWDTEAVSVGGDAMDHTVEEEAVLNVDICVAIDVAEAQAV